MNRSPRCKSWIFACLAGLLATSVFAAYPDKQLATLGIETVCSSPAAFGALVRSEVPRRADIVKQAGAHAD